MRASSLGFGLVHVRQYLPTFQPDNDDTIIEYPNQPARKVSSMVVLVVTLTTTVVVGVVDAVFLLTLPSS